MYAYMSFLLGCYAMNSLVASRLASLNKSCDDCWFCAEVPLKRRSFMSWQAV